VCIEKSPGSGSDRNVDLARKELANLLFEIINRLKRVSPTDKSDVPTLRGKIELQHSIP
jgi:hypothetical protein